MRVRSGWLPRARSPGVSKSPQVLLSIKKPNYSHQKKSYKAPRARSQHPFPSGAEGLQPTWGGAGTEAAAPSASQSPCGPEGRPSPTPTAAAHGSWTCGPWRRPLPCPSLLRAEGRPCRVCPQPRFWQPHVLASAPGEQAGPGRTRGQSGMEVGVPGPAGGERPSPPSVSSEGRSASSSLSSAAGSWEGMTESCRETGHYRVAGRASSFWRHGETVKIAPKSHALLHTFVHVTQTGASPR